MRDAQDPDVLSDRRVGRPGLRWSLPVAAVVLVADQLTKWWALENLVGNSISLPAGVTLNLHFNTGAAFSQGEGLGPVLGVVATIMTVMLLEFSRRRPDRLSTAMMGAVAGGALGNVADRLFRATDGVLSGAVVDFIDLGWWPVFNVADSAIVVGIVSVILISLFEPVPDEADRSEDQTDLGDPPTTGADLEGSDEPPPNELDQPGGERTPSTGGAANRGVE